MKNRLFISFLIVVFCGGAYAQHLYTYHDGLALAILNNKYGYLDKSGKLAIPAQFDQADRFSEGLARVKLGGKYGYIDRTGRLVIPCRFDDAKGFSNGVAQIIRIENSSPSGVKQWFGFIDKSGKVIVTPQYEQASSFSDGLAAVQFGNGYYFGYIDTAGKLVFSNKETAFRYMDGFHEGMARVSDGSRWGFIDKNFTAAVPFQFDYAIYFSDGMAGVKSDGKWGYINLKGELVIKPQFDKADVFQDGVAVIETGGSRRLINKQGEFLGEGKYTSLSYDPVSKMFVVNRAASWALIDRMGGVVLSFNNIDKISPPRDGLTLVVQDCTYAFVDAQGKFLILPAYNNAQSFSESRAAVRAGTKWGFIDQHGRVIIVYEYDEVLPFHEGLAGVRNGGFWGVIDRNGKLIAGLRYESAPQN